MRREIACHATRHSHGDFRRSRIIPNASFREQVRRRDTSARAERLNNDTARRHGLNYACVQFVAALSNVVRRRRVTMLATARRIETTIDEFVNCEADCLVAERIRENCVSQLRPALNSHRHSVS